MGDRDFFTTNQMREENDNHRKMQFNVPTLAMAIRELKEIPGLCGESGSSHAIWSCAMLGRGPSSQTFYTNSSSALFDEKDVMQQVQTY